MSVNKGKIIAVAACVVALSFAVTQASVFSGSGGASLQSTFNSLGYDYIDVADYQTNLNFNMQGMMEFELLSKNSSMSSLSFGVLEGKSSWWGNYYQHHTVLGSGADLGSIGRFDMSDPRSTYGFYIQKQSGNRWWQTTRYYSYSPFNSYGAVQTLFYENPMNSGEYLLAFEALYVGNSHSDRSYDDLVVSMRKVHPAPEPATWILLASGLLGIGVFATSRRKQNQLT